MQLLARFADALRQRGFDVHVHIFKLALPLELAGLDVGIQAIQAVDDRLEFGRREHADFA